MFKNVASQKIAVFAFDITTGAPKTGDAANITVYVSKDWGSVTALGDTSATEMDATNAKGYYLFDLTQGETNADALLFTAKSTTANISIVGQLIFTLPPNFTTQAIDSNGRIDLGAVNGDATAAANLAKTTRAIGRGTVTSGATTTSIPTSAFAPAGASADQFKGRIVTFDSDTATTGLRGQATDITASTSAAAPTLTVSALSTAPASGDTFSIT